MFPTIGFMLLLTCTTIVPTKAKQLKTYIVYLTPPQGHASSQPHDLQKWYHSYLSQIATSSNEKPKLVYAYRHVITGFAAKMSSEQANVLKNMSRVAFVRPKSVFRLHTTHSPDFLGLYRNSGFWKDSNYGEGIIIGVLDTGVTPTHPSFNDEGVPPPPSRWKGKCVLEGCNNKLIGMRNFIGASSAVDQHGHGTHTSSTAAGNFVDDANVFGNANGTATGMAPLAHLAMYRVCSRRSCGDSDTLAGIDAAIEDGVDVLSISLGSRSMPFYRDAISIGSFAAIQKGIFVSCSAGNSGPWRARLSNEAPWILTVGASSIDRKIRTTVYLGNKKLFDGESLYQPKKLRQKLLPLVYPGENGSYRAATCRAGSLDDIDVKGKVVLCDSGGMFRRIEKGKVVKEAGGAAMILTSSISCPESTIPDAHVLPASNVGYKEGIEIKKYLSSTSSPLATILLRGTVLGIESAPEVACFSSRGPNRASPGILKPDIIGPGVDILAAWPRSVDNKTETKATFKLLSGTSMSCPHLAGIAALLKRAHPEWSPAAIKSAMMTTAGQVSLNGKAIVDERELAADVFAIGAGQVNPAKANDPGLIFDIRPDDYIPYLCGLDYTTRQIRSIIKKSFSCFHTIREAELNYPSFAITLRRGERKTYSRTVTNVGKASSSYTIGDVSVPEGVSMEVNSPSEEQEQELRFTAVHQKVTYKVTFGRDMMHTAKTTYDQGYMTWVSGEYSVRTPFSFSFR